MSIRLQKIIAQAGLASRREAERLISAGSVTVNGKVVTTLGAKADPLADAIKVDGKLIARRDPPAYFVMHKPRNVLTTMRDEENKGRPTVADLLPSGRRRVFPVGRLDFDVEGVLLLTNDGELANRLAHPRHQIPRVYEVKVNGIPGERALTRMAKGAGLHGPAPEGADVRLLQRKGEINAWIRIELREGRQHQVKRMCQAVGHVVLKLVRRSFGGINMRGLTPGDLRPLTPEEVRRLKVLTGLAEESAPGPEGKPGRSGPKAGGRVSKAGWAKAAASPRRPRRKAAERGGKAKKSPRGGKTKKDARGGKAKKSPRGGRPSR
ncbi:MAG: pseudouridine synthase [bacterium]